jgi:hypothetical protein
VKGVVVAEDVAIGEEVLVLPRTPAELILTPHERQRHKEEELCFKYQKTGHLVFQCTEVKGKEPVDTQNKQK